MGLRGPGAGRRKQTAAAAEKPRRGRPRKPPWERKGLNRWQRVRAFLEDLPVTKGMLAGTKMKLLPSQLAFVKQVYGRLDKQRRRVVRIGIKSQPAGNGKTGFCAGLHLCHLLGPEAEQRGECDAAAVDRTQSSKMFDEIEAILLEVPAFAGRVNIKRHEKTIEVLDGHGKGSKFQAMSGDARKGHGLAPSFWTYDELAQVKDRALLDNLMARMGKRHEALGLIISTQAESDEHPLSALIDDGLAGNDRSLHVQLTAAPEEADPFDRKTVRAVNEALGVFLNEVDVFNDLERARRMPAWEPKYRNERLNQRVASNAEARICTKAVWDEGRVAVEAEALKGRACYGGLDLSGKHDLCALELVFPDDAAEPGYDILSFFWTPQGQLATRPAREADLFRLWIEQGHLIAVPGPTIRYGFIGTAIAELSGLYDIRAIGYDRWRIDDFRQDLDGIGCDVPLEKFGQGFHDMSPAVDIFAELALTGKLRHGGHPVLSACVANAVLTRDPAGNQKFDKGRANNRGTVRIDGAVALAMALGTARRFDDAPKAHTITSDQIVARGGLL